MRLSRPDESDSTKRRHFEISIDSPFTILSCRATQANTSLPAYVSATGLPSCTDQHECGCPGSALRRRITPPGHSPIPAALRSGRNDSTSSLESLDGRRGRAHSSSQDWSIASPGLARPTAAHTALHANDPNSAPAARPMHLLRSPSFNPPAFSEDDPPPPLITPPPNYENEFGRDANSTLADYFARLADEIGDEDDMPDPGRVNVPLTPGGRVSRSIDLHRLPSRNVTPRLGMTVPPAAQRA